MRKIRVFLGGYINYTNAQNLNCRALSTYLNKERFIVFALQTHFGDDIKTRANTFTCRRPSHFTRHLGYLWGVYNCDIAYFPKHSDTPGWVLRFARLINKPIFTTIEGIETIQRLITSYGSAEKVVRRFKYFDNIYAITTHILNHTKYIELDNSLLLLGVNTSQFTVNISKELRSIVFIGSLIKRKRVEEIVELAINYPKIKFNVIGDGSERNKLESHSPSNVEFYGILTHNEINRVFEQSDLMFLPARSEGFPKVILEAASAGIPSIVYNTYGASYWMEDKINGFIVADLDQVKKIINKLLDNPELLQVVSENVVKLAEKFDWRNVINDWEEVINNLYNGK